MKYEIRSDGRISVEITNIITFTFDDYNTLIQFIKDIKKIAALIYVDKMTTTGRADIV